MTQCSWLSTGKGKKKKLREKSKSKRMVVNRGKNMCSPWSTIPSAALHGVRCGGYALRNVQVTFVTQCVHQTLRCVCSCALSMVRKKRPLIEFPPNFPSAWPCRARRLLACQPNNATLQVWWIMEDDISVPTCLGAACDTWLPLWRLNSANPPLAFHYPLVKYSFGNKMIKNFIASLKWGLFSKGLNDFIGEYEYVCVCVGTVCVQTCGCLHVECVCSDKCIFSYVWPVCKNLMRVICFKAKPPLFSTKRPGPSLCLK